MPTTSHDDIPERAVRDAVRELKPGAEQREAAFIVAAVAANRVRQALTTGLTETERYAAMNAAARQALGDLAARNAYRRGLVGGIESLTHQQQMALALRHQEGLTDAEIAAVMGLQPAEVRVLFLSAYQTLGDMT